MIKWNTSNDFANLWLGRDGRLTVLLPLTQCFHVSYPFISNLSSINRLRSAIQSFSLVECIIFHFFLYFIFRHHSLFYTHRELTFKVISNHNGLSLGIFSDVFNKYIFVAYLEPGSRIVLQIRVELSRKSHGGRQVRMKVEKRDTKESKHGKILGQEHSDRP